jgi:hypothetical protein
MDSFDRRFLGTQIISQDWLQKSGSSLPKNPAHATKAINTEIEHYGHFSVLD